MSIPYPLTVNVMVCSGNRPQLALSVIVPAVSPASSQKPVTPPLKLCSDGPMIRPGPSRVKLIGSS
jgi:hypothetical protein